METAQVSTAIAEYSKTESALSALAKLYKDVVFDVTSATGMAMARKARSEIKGYRTSLENMRVEIKAPALKRCQMIDSEAKRITAALTELEEPIDRQIKGEEERKENERIAKARAEADRIAAEQKALRDAEEKKLAEQRAEIERRQAELDRQEAERLAVEKEARLKIEAEERAARLRIEEEERKARLAREEADRVARVARDKELAEEKARLKAESDMLEAEKRRVEEVQRKAREAEEAKAREILRKKNEVIDARDMLETFINRFGHIEEFSKIVTAIRELT